MSVFGNYARYYDLLYRDKKYTDEVNYIVSLLQRYAPESASILELGCGTGIHASLLAKAGYAVHGIDFSQEMLESAKARIASFIEDAAERLSFCQGDIRSYRTDRVFDVAVSLFHVISYQISEKDINAAIGTAKSHLKPGGIFVFDFWYGPAVLTDHPVVRVKRLEDDSIRVTRIAEPVMHPNENCVDVNYQVLIEDKATGIWERLEESHRMRYLFLPELDRMLDANGMTRLNAEEWMTGKELGFDTWGGCVVARV